MKKALIIFLMVSVFGCVSSFAQFSIPYTNSFDTGTAVGWTHYALYGQDNWQLGVPSFTLQNFPYSTPNCWGTNLTGNYSGNSGMCLQSPAFDFSSSATGNVLSFWHSRAHGTGTVMRVEYSTDGGTTWTTLYSTNPALTRNWHSNSNGWTSSNTLWNQSCYSLSFLNGQPDVRLRFYLTSTTAVAGGWLIDNFYVGPEYFNLYPAQGDTISRVSALMPTFNVVTDLYYSNQYSATFADSIKYYLSEDAIFDAGDTLLGSFLRNHAGNVTNYTNALPVPPGIHSGEYHVFIEMDSPDNLAEDNESDNVNFAILIIDSTINTPYITAFDDPMELQWDVYVLANCSVPDYWTLATPYRHHLDGAHSGEHAWSSSDAVVNWQNNGCGGYVESPFINLTTVTNPVVAFWYTNFGGGSWIWNPSYIRYSTNGATPASLLLEMDYYSDNDDWDYQVISLTSFASEEYLKLGFYTTVSFNSSGGAEGMAFDDVYIGPAIPDVSIEGDKEDRFTAVNNSADTLFYWFVNSGIGSVTGTTTYFYWSSDSILDGSDVLLGSKTEPALTDTSGVWTYFAYTKPTNTAGRYFVFYVADSTDVIAEMREYNNRGSFIVHQENLVALPYVNDFETQVDGWRHDASLGADDWNWGVPTGSVLDTAFSGTKAWITNANGDTLSQMSRCHLYTPVFDFTAMTNPVMEFDLLHHPWLPSNWTMAGGNISYSVDGGATWTVLDTTSQSFKEWYYREEYESYGGIDKLYYLPMTNQYLFADEERTFVPTFDYQTRATRRTTHFVLDISFLAGQENVQFRFNYASFKAQSPGILIDNFSITSPTVDYLVDYQKNLKWSAQSDSIRFYVEVLNNGNSRSPATTINFYLSADSLLDGSDLYLAAENVPQLRPEYTHLLNKEYPVSSWAGYSYLLMQCDPNNLIVESNESNNITAWNLGLNDTIVYPYLNDFSDSVIDGWTWYHTSAIYEQYRFRHKKVIADPVYNCETDMWFLDRINNIISQNSQIPRFYLESPVFDFTGCGEVELEFDLLCIGSGGTQSSGGNIEYSIDGGDTWIVLNSPSITNEVNWYNGSMISTLNNQAGWYSTPGDTMMHCSADISFLVGQPEVKFRFTYKSKQLNTNPGVQGMRVDNFSVNTFTVDYVATVPPATVVNTPVAQPFVSITYDILNTGSGNGQSTYTKLYWSTDTILDSGDSLLYNYLESPIPSGGNISSARNIYYPQPVSQMVYYLFYYTDSDSALAELSETNNITYFEIHFDSLNIGIPENQNQNYATLNSRGSELYITTDFVAQTGAEVQVFDSRGVMVYSSEFVFDQGRSETPLLVGLSSGLYSMQLIDDKGRIYSDQTILIQ